MSFLDDLEPAHRALLEGVATPIALDRGAYLIRRGEAGGDFFVIDEGQVEIVDSRSIPETILAVLSPGATFGEVSFVDDSPRSADARARGPARVRRWSREDVRALIRREPSLGSRFYECIARVTTGHLRNQTSANHARRARTDGATLAGVERMRADVLAFATATRAALVDAETMLRQEPDSPSVHAAIARAFDGVQAWMAAHYEAWPEPELAVESTRLLTGELHPYMVRSALADLCIRRAHGAASLTEVLDRALTDTPDGDGAFGPVVDRWLLDRPTLRALRATRGRLVPLVLSALGDRRPLRIAVVNAGAGALVRELVRALGDTPTELTVVDPSRDALARCTALDHPPTSSIAGLQANLVDVALGRGRYELPAQDAILAHDLIDYLPDRLALGLLTHLGQSLAAGGALALAAMAPSPDRDLLDRLLGWPTVRRRPDRLGRLLDRAGFDHEMQVSSDDPLILVSARARVGSAG
jgi:extracellular factor (EF) 3-hydroxypalmitic acid methyl ester biosynthesis protein